MIKLTQKNKLAFWVNPNFILSVGEDEEGDVYVSANNNNVVYVEETVEEVLFKMGVDTKGPNA